MKIVLIILAYLRWHYGRALRSLSIIWGNFLYFILEFFSFKLLCKNFFDPWKRMDTPYPKIFKLKEYFYTFIANTIVRVVGMIMRTFLILIGFISYILLILLYPMALICWLFLPLILIFLIVYGLYLIII